MSSIKFLARLGKNAFYCGQQHASQLYMRSPVTATMAISCSKYYTNTALFDRKPQHLKLGQYSLLARCHNPFLPTSVVDIRCISLRAGPDYAGKSESKSSSASVTNGDIFGDTSKLSLFEKFKLMYKKYWYVLIPVHAVTSIAWFASFYYMSVSGVDLPSLLHHLHFSDAIVDKMQNSKMGHFAIAYLLYKITTPVRYAVTLGGTTFSIKYLVQAGHIKPMPSKKRIIELYEQKKADRAAAKSDKKDSDKFDNEK